VRLATDVLTPPWEVEARSEPLAFIRPRRSGGVSWVWFDVEQKSDLETGKLDDSEPLE
jgi:hypothetical protein